MYRKSIVTLALSLYRYFDQLQICCATCRTTSCAQYKSTTDRSSAVRALPVRWETRRRTSEVCCRSPAAAAATTASAADNQRQRNNCRQQTPPTTFGAAPRRITLSIRPTASPPPGRFGRQTRRQPPNRKYIAYRNAARAGWAGARGNMHGIFGDGCMCSFCDMRASEPTVL